MSDTPPRPDKDTEYVPAFAGGLPVGDDEPSGADFAYAARTMALPVYAPTPIDPTDAVVVTDATTGVQTTHTVRLADPADRLVLSDAFEEAGRQDTADALRWGYEVVIADVVRRPGVSASVDVRRDDGRTFTKTWMYHTKATARVDVWRQVFKSALGLTTALYTDYPEGDALRHGAVYVRDGGAASDAYRRMRQAEEAIREEIIRMYVQPGGFFNRDGV